MMIEVIRKSDITNGVRLKVSYARTGFPPTAQGGGSSEHDREAYFSARELSRVKNKGTTGKPLTTKAEERRPTSYF